MTGRTVLALGLLWVAPARAEFLPDAPRAIPLSTSASRDAPVVEYAYGPLAQLSLGGELGLYRRVYPRLDLRVSVYALLATENGTSQMPVPDEVYRLLFGFTVSHAWHQPRWLRQRGVLELSLGLGREEAGTMGSYTLPQPPPPDAIPFGGGGTFLTQDLAWRGPVGPVELTLRLDNRLHLPGLLLIFGQRVPADVFEDVTYDGLIDEAALEAELRWPVHPRWQPLLSAHAAVLAPVDASSRTGYFVRGLLGVAVTSLGRAGELIAFLSGDAGNGQGELINQRALRLSGGLRYAPRY